MGLFEIYSEAFESKLVNPDVISYGVNSLRLGGFNLLKVNSPVLS